MRSWMVVWPRRMRQKMAPKMRAEEMLVPARARLVALSRVACRHDRASSSLPRTNTPPTSHAASADCRRLRLYTELAAATLHPGGRVRDKDEHE